MTTPDPPVLVQPGCPVCNRPLAPTQSWCLECGAAARTRIAPTPRWRPLAVIAVLAAILAIVAIGFAVARLARGSPSTGAIKAPLTSQVGRPPSPSAV